ncbi:MAG: hypothetical protein HXX08_16135 [Chloroflexi bacterium]|uniref:Uncharacterized protein n=1 Tax=Candidatus Chlorohelix allophototropha TaxID=3003348 RepID=A0A8T7M5K7_9CHLR|nr:hypothetical protein [Chloroflexota bacterium]WJW69300.1 hypothetical protein OZ401_002908 [Chloroflexota bacterium L227-S17]
MGAANRRAFLVDILRYTGEFLITCSLSFFLYGLLLGVWEDFRAPFQGYIPLLIPIIYITSRAVMSLFRVYQQVVDLLQGPETLACYVTLHDLQTIWKQERGRSWAYREAIGQRCIVNIVPAESFARWLGKPDWQIHSDVAEAEYRFAPDPTALSTELLEQKPETISRRNHGVYPITLETPRWVFDLVQLGDLIRITLSRRTHRIYNVEVLLSVMMPE